MIFSYCYQMKLFPPVLAFALFLLFSCNKSLDKPVETEKRTTLRVSDLVRNLDSTVLTISLVPEVVCYSYPNGSVPRPCDIFVEIRCVLSRPIRAGINVELTRSNTTGMLKYTVEPAMIGLYIAPNTRQISFRTTLSNKNNQAVTDTYRISSLFVYNLIN